MIRIVVVDDHDIVRAGICALIQAKCPGEIEVAGEAGTGRDALKLCGQLKPEVLVLDLEIPDLDGFDVTRQVKALYPETRVLILTMYDREEYAIRVIQAGAAGFVAKWASPKELPEAIKKVASGKIHITASIMESMISRKLKPEEEDPVSRLSDRELQALVRLARGMEILEISAELGVGYSTVATYKTRLLEKLNLRNVSDLTRFAIQNNLIDKY